MLSISLCSAFLLRNRHCLVTFWYETILFKYMSEQCNVVNLEFSGLV